MKKILYLQKALCKFDLVMSKWGADLMGLTIRLYVGWQFFHSGALKLGWNISLSGLNKIGDWESTVALFRDEYHVPVLPPELAAVMGAGGELLLPLLLFVGLLSRPAALGLFAVNAMAVISYPQLFKFDCPAAINDHFYWGALLLVTATFGPGRIALDQWLAKRMRDNPTA